MPKPDKYLSGFGLQKGSYLDGFYLTDISIGHDVIKRYREYAYPTTLVWRKYDNTANYSKLIFDLPHFLQGNRIIYTAYGNPYSCNFGTLNVSSANSEEVIFTSQGKCDRVYL